jgi:hypothetical protein
MKRDISIAENPHAAERTSNCGARGAVADQQFRTSRSEFAKVQMEAQAARGL